MFLQRLCRLPLLLCLIQLAAAKRSSMSGRTRSGRPQEPHTVQVHDISETRMALRCFKSIELVTSAQWTKDGQSLEEIATADTRLTIYHENITIDGVLPGDEGVYRCNGGEKLRLTVPPHITRTQPLVLMEDIGSNFTLPCGIVLGAISHTKSYKVEWQRLSRDGKFTTISSCIHSDSSEQQSDRGCNSDFSFDDFSLGIRNFSVTDSDLNTAGREVKFKCIVELLFQPSFDRFSIHRTVNTIVNFRYEPASVRQPLPQFTVTQPGKNLTLSIAFTGYPIVRGGVEWAINGDNVERPLISHTDTSSSLMVSSDSLKQGDTISAAVNVLDVSSVSTTTTIILLSRIDDVTVARPTECSAPVLRLNIPSPIPIPRDSDSHPTVWLHVEYTKIDTESNTTDMEFVLRQYDADILTQSTHVEVGIESLPYMLLSWNTYVIRVRLEVLGVVSDHWSQYSRPLCIHCEECLNPPGVKINLLLLFQDTCSKMLNPQMIEGTRDGIVNELTQLIQESCPVYLCRDLLLSEVDLSCSLADSNVVQFSALARGVEAQNSIRVFLETVSSQEEPLRLYNGTIVPKPSPSPTPHPSSVPRSRHSVAPIAGYSVGGLTVLLIAMISVLACTVRQCKRRSKENSSNTEGTTTETVAETNQLTPPSPSPQMTPVDLDLGLTHQYIPPPTRYKPGTPHLQTPLQCHSHVTGHHHHFSPHTPSPSPLTMTEAGDLVQNLDDGSSMDYSTYAHSEISFISQVPIPGHHQRSPSSTPVTPTAQRQRLDPSLISHTSNYRSRDMMLPLSQFHNTTRTPVSSCLCSYHSRESTPMATSPSPSTSLLDSPRHSPFKYRHKRLASSPLLSTPPLQHVQAQHHYQLWVSRGHTHSPSDHTHAPSDHTHSPSGQLAYFLARDRQGRLESPV